MRSLKLASPERHGKFQRERLSFESRHLASNSRKPAACLIWGMSALPCVFLVKF
jgi:hypothetical protein